MVDRHLRSKLPEPNGSGGRLLPVGVLDLWTDSGGTECSGIGKSEELLEFGVASAQR